MRTAFKAAPRGQRSGLVVAGGSAGTVRITVLPKAWRTGPPAVRHWEWASEDRELSLVLHEGDTAVVDAEKNAVQIVERAVAESYAAAERDDAGRRDPLLRSVSLNAVGSLDDWLGGVEGPSVSHVLALYRRSGLGRLTALESLRHDGSPSTARLLLPLLYRDLVDELERSMRLLRRGYVAVKDELHTVRGRVLTSGLARLVATGEPRLVCEYDEFTPATRLVRVMARALDVVVQRAPSVSFSLGDPMTLTARAVHLRRSLRAGPPLHVRTAAAWARSIRLTPLERGLRRALDLAGYVLRDEDYRPSSSDLDIPAIEVVVPTYRVWERVLYEAARQRTGEGWIQDALDGNVKNDRVEVPAPWQGASGRPLRPDLLMRVGSEAERWCVDAKYKRLRNGRAPELDDLYQMFAYSHLVRLDGEGVRASVLVYPAEPAVSGSRRATLRRSGHTGQHYPLHVVTAPFPSPDDVQTDATWKRYLERLGYGLERTLKENTELVTA